jgi:hypothetical protein
MDIGQWTYHFLGRICLSSCVVYVSLVVSHCANFSHAVHCENLRNFIYEPSNLFHETAHISCRVMVFHHFIRIYKLVRLVYYYATFESQITIPPCS